MSVHGAAARILSEDDAPALRCTPDRFPRALTHGTLETYGVEQIVLGLRAGHRSGTLVFGSKEAPNAEVVFEGGHVRKVRSTLSAYLGGVLYELGYVDPETLNASLAAVAQRRVPHGTVLQECGSVRPEQLRLGLLEQMERRIADLVGLNAETAWVFHEDVDLLPRYGGADWPLVDPMGAIWRGLRQNARLDLMHGVLAAAGDDRFVLIQDVSLDTLKLTAEERAVAETFRTPRTAKSRPAPLSATTIASLAYMLLGGGFLRPAPKVSTLLRMEQRESVRIESSPHLALSRVRALAQAGRMTEALSVARASVERFPEAVELGVEAAWIHANEPGSGGRSWDESQVKVFDALLAANPGCASAYFFRFKLLRRLGLAADAFRDLSRAVEEDPRHIDATRELRLIESRMTKGQTVDVAMLCRTSGVQRK